MDDFPILQFLLLHVGRLRGPRLEPQVGPCLLLLLAARGWAGGRMVPGLERQPRSLAADGRAHLCRPLWLFHVSLKCGSQPLSSPEPPPRGHPSGPLLAGTSLWAQVKMGPNHKRCTSLLDLTASSLVPLLFPLGGGQGSGVRGRPGYQAHVPLVHCRAGMSIESVMPSSHLILCRHLLLLPPIPPSSRVFSSESTLLMRWPKY